MDVPDCGALGNSTGPALVGGVVGPRMESGRGAIWPVPAAYSAGGISVASRSRPWEARREWCCPRQPWAVWQVAVAGEVVLSDLRAERVAAREAYDEEVKCHFVRESPQATRPGRILRYRICPISWLSLQVLVKRT